MKVFVEGFGCSANIAETEQIKGFLQSKSKELILDPKKADFIIVNSCGVKKATEFKMHNRIRKLKQLNPNAKIIVSGCLPKINFSLLEKEKNLFQTGPELEGIAELLDLPSASFSPVLSVKPLNPFVSIIPVSCGCLSKCSFCATKNARGKLKSYSISSIKSRFSNDLKKGIKEFWLTSQDNGCYGFDRKTSLPKLLESLLSEKENFRIRIGMLSPQYPEKYLDEFIELFSDERLFRFLHLPVQSGNNRILSLMNRQYSAESFELLVKEFRRKIPGISISTDIITGFPTETEKEFLDSLQLIERIKPDVINISRYGLRPETKAAELSQIIDREKTNRSRVLAVACKKIFLEKNMSFIGKKETILVSEKAKTNGFIGRTNSYKPVVVPKAVLGEFSTAIIQEAFSHFLKGTAMQ